MSKEYKDGASHDWLDEEREKIYRGENRKAARFERKLASKLDRTKYKKTDMAKTLKRREENQERRVSTEGLKKGRVLSITTAGMEVECEGKRWLCHLRGALKKEKTLAKNLVTVGDFVFFSESHHNEGVVELVAERSTVLSRAENLDRRKEQLIAANIDQVLITLSVVIPPLKSSLADRYIIASSKGGMKPIIIVNKVDLLSGYEDEVLAEKAFLEDFIEAYRSPELPVVCVSVETGEGLDELRNLMKGKSSVFSGPSGVGKSSLINAITGLDLPIGDMVLKTKKGAHTTTTARLIPLDFGGWCIDTPGIKSFGVWDLEVDEIKHYFKEISEFGKDCKFFDCSHSHEEGCSVKKALDEGKISPLRYDSYLVLMESVEERHRRR